MPNPITATTSTSALEKVENRSGASRSGHWVTLHRYGLQNVPIFGRRACVLELSGMRCFSRALVLVVAVIGFGIPTVRGDEPESAVGPLMKLFQGGRLPAERQGTVVEMICNRGNSNDLKVVFDKIVQPDGFTPDLRLKAMQWMTDAAVTRKVRPAEIGRAVQQECRDRSRMPSSA
eukprot:TRINITY_DN314_c0_g1_i15.p1 TRINITY_DN314_c0_g1~~TRINITY_DN314_c0_g1_i15.p1  ORF type:complete len:176 (-),score=34.57 TRINITY_DN314_c0_g1_i15:25-552(-)